MEIKQAFLVGLTVLLVAVFRCCLADSQVAVSTTNGLDPHLTDPSRVGDKKGEPKPVSHPNEVRKEQASESEEGGKVNKDHSSSESVSNGNNREQNSKSSEEFPEDKSDHNAGGNSINSQESKPVPEKKSNEGSTEEHSNLPDNKGSRAEQCDPSYKCTNKDKKLIACLRVAGDDYTHLSLFIQNKGKGPLNVTISAPIFVKLDNSSVQLPENQNAKVGVSITNGGSGNWIVLTAGNSPCKLDIKDIKDLIARNSGKDLNGSYRSSYINFWARHTIAVLSIGALLILASSWMCISSRKKQNSKYQRLDMELPVAAAPKAESDVNDGWDNNWGDDWDEEAPRTPSLPVTPSLSSKGLASRRLSKEGWKD